MAYTYIQKIIRSYAAVIVRLFRSQRLQCKMFSSDDSIFCNSNGISSAIKKLLIKNKKKKAQKKNI